MSISKYSLNIRLVHMLRIVIHDIQGLSIMKERMKRGILSDVTSRNLLRTSLVLYTERVNILVSFPRQDDHSSRETLTDLLTLRGQVHLLRLLYVLTQHEDSKNVVNKMSPFKCNQIVSILCTADDLILCNIRLVKSSGV